MREIKRVTVHFKDIDIDVVHKNVKRVSLRIIPGRNILTLPIYVSVDEGLSFVASKYEWIKKTINRVERNLDRISPPGQSEMRIFTELSRRRMEYWCSVMKCGDVSLRFRLMKSRWGSCRPDTRSVCLNLYLYAYSLNCLDYVIIHELAHLYRGAHDRVFWNIVKKYCPDWKLLRRKLRDVPDKI